MLGGYTLVLFFLYTEYAYILQKYTHSGSSIQFPRTDKCEFLFHNKIVHGHPHIWHICHYIPFACIKPDGTVGGTMYFTKRKPLLLAYIQYTTYQTEFLYAFFHTKLLLYVLCKTGLELSFYSQKQGKNIFDEYRHIMNRQKTKH